MLEMLLMLEVLLITYFRHLDINLNYHDLHITMILYKRVKSQGVSDEEHDFIIGTPMNHYGATHILHEGIDISKSCFFSLTP